MRKQVRTRVCSTPVLTGPVSVITYDEFQREQRSNYPNFQDESDFFGSWLSSITGIHINPLDLGATKIDLGQAARTVGAIASAATGNIVAAGGLIGQNIKNSGLLTPSTSTAVAPTTTTTYAPVVGTLPSIDYNKGTATLNGISVPIALYNQLGANAFTPSNAQLLAPVNITAPPAINPWLMVGAAVAVALFLTPSHKAHKVAS